MQIHDWTKVKEDAFHSLHLAWIGLLQTVLNKEILPPGYYAMGERITGGLEPDVSAFESPSRPAQGGTAVLAPPRVRKTMQQPVSPYTSKQRSLAVRSEGDDKLVCMMEIVSAGNKHSRASVRDFVAKFTGYLSQGVNGLLVDLHPPSPRDPNGMHDLIWKELFDADYDPEPGETLMVASYECSPIKTTAYLEPRKPGEPMPDMPLYLAPGFYVTLPLARTYREAFEGLPKYVIERLEET